MDMKGAAAEIPGRIYGNRLDLEQRRPGISDEPPRRFSFLRVHGSPGIASS